MGPIESFDSGFMVCKKNDKKYTQAFLCVNDKSDYKFVSKDVRWIYWDYYEN